MNTRRLTAIKWIAGLADLLGRLAVGPELLVLLHVKLSVVHHGIERHYWWETVVRSERVLHIGGTLRFS